MKQTKSILIALLAMATCGTTLHAQDAAPRHEVSVNFQGLGLGSMPFDGPQSWEDQPGLSLGFGMGYTYWFAQHFGFHTGFRINHMTHNQKISNLDMPVTASLPLSSLGLPGGSALTTVNLRATAKSIEEEQTYSYIELPIQLAMRFDRFFLNFGISLAKAVHATADYSYDSPACTVTGLPDLGITVASPVPLTLSGAQENEVKNKDMNKPFFCLLAAEAGWNIPVGETTSLSVGLFGRWAPKAYETDNDVDAYTIQSDATFQLRQPSTSKMVEKKGYYEVGLSLGLNLGLGKKATKSVDNNAPVLAPVDNSADRAALEAAEKKLAAERVARKNAEAELEALKASQAKAEAERLAAAEKEAQRLAAAEKEAIAKARQPKDEKSQQLDNVDATVYFHSAGTKVQSDEQTDAAIQAICTAMKADSKLKVTVFGHTDNTGSAKTNMGYGMRRAQALKAYMVKLGAPAENINCESKGQKEPVADNKTAEGRAKNRRATVKMK